MHRSDHIILKPGEPEISNVFAHVSKIMANIVSYTTFFWASNQVFSAIMSISI